ncbi:hypothetical protein E4U43_004618, partial [Claviceps pusilla]
RAAAARPSAHCADEDRLSVPRISVTKLAASARLLQRWDPALQIGSKRRTEMKAIQIKEYVKSPTELKVTELPDPVPESDEYLIEIRAAATNFFDVLQIAGKYQSQPPFPWIAGVEFAGVVISTPRGSKNPRFPRGCRVFGASQGAYATKCTAKEVSMLPVPDGWSFTEAAGLFITAPTSYGALVVRAHVKKGDYVLVHAAAGGVGLAAVQ